MKEDEALEIGHATRNTVRWKRTSTNQLKITIKDEGRFRRNSNDAAELHGHGFKKSFTEHGHVLGYMVVRADLTYSQGINRMWSRKTRFDFYWPAFAHLPRG
jgi:hypothetical protein